MIFATRVVCFHHSLLNCHMKSVLITRSYHSKAILQTDEGNTVADLRLFFREKTVTKRKANLFC